MKGSLMDDDYLTPMARVEEALQKNDIGEAASAYFQYLKKTLSEDGVSLRDYKAAMRISERKGMSHSELMRQGAKLVLLGMKMQIVAMNPHVDHINSIYDEVCEFKRTDFRDVFHLKHETAEVPPEPEARRRKRGRPKGSTNKKKPLT